MAEKGKAKAILVAVCVWAVIIAVIVAAAYKLWWLPWRESKLLDQTGSVSQYTDEIRIAADPYSGYAIYRSPEFQNVMRNTGVKVTVVDDKADYSKRIRMLKSGDVKMAVFTVDSFINACNELGAWPGAIVTITDESKGADGIATFGSIPTLSDLDNPKARFVLTPDSPSHFLARIAKGTFGLMSMPEKWWIEANGSAEVFKKMKNADRSEPYAYVLWEPELSQARELGASIPLDSSKLKGFILDVLVVQREYLSDSPDKVREFVEAYFRTLYKFDSDSSKSQLFVDDAKRTGGNLSRMQAERILRGIELKGVMDNYAYFSLVPSPSPDFENLEDCVGKIAKVLQETGAVKGNALSHGAGSLFSKQILASMMTDNFHPGKQISGVDLGLGTKDLGSVTQTTKLRELSDDEWNNLVPAGQVRVQELPFRRGQVEMFPNGEVYLSELANTLRSFPGYYVKVTGHTTGTSSSEKELADGRAKVVVDFIVSKGIAVERIKAEGKIADTKGGSQSVTFTLGQLPF